MFSDFLNNTIRFFSVLGWRDFVEILVLAVIFYRVFLFIKGTRTIQVMKGLFIIVLVALLAKILNLYTISWILEKVLAIGVIAILIVFQPELRRALSRIGQNPLNISLQEDELIDEIVKSVNMLSRKNIGALIVIGREIGLKDYMETGVRINAKVTSELLSSIFTPNSPLHDGAVIIERGELVAASCILPLVELPNIGRVLGTRHRAALSLTKETDATVIVVSEETGGISVAIRRKLTRDIDGITLRKILHNLYAPSEKSKKAFWIWKRNK
ncbi:MAG: diadenylate cyclase CdaA [bacterium]